MSAIVEFLLARYGEEERELDAPEFVEDPTSVRGPGWGGRGDCPICGAYQFDGTEVVTEEGWYEHAETVHQRSHVLADLKAKRAIVARHPGIALAHLPDGPYVATRFRHELYCAPDQVPFPCPHLRDLAAVYADHPDYREEWKP